MTEQQSLFDLSEPLPAGLPPGLLYEPDFLSLAEETALIELVASLPFSEAEYKGYTARRRVVSYGGSFDYDANRLEPTTDLIDALHPLRDRVADWLKVRSTALVHALVSEYRPGTPLGWHRDVPNFEDIVGVSLGTPAVLQFRPYPPVKPQRADIVRLTVAPRSIYAMRGLARWQWQHRVPATQGLRWSITFRTAAHRQGAHAARTRGDGNFSLG